MKLLRIKYCLLLTAVTLTGLLVSCDDDTDFGTPEILNVRITDPAKADSSITGGGLGQMVVIQGRNLASVQELYFNSEPAFINTTLITNTNVIVEIPSDFPKEITNQIRLVTKGGVAVYDFAVDIPKPVVVDVRNEFTPAGGEAIILGQFFYNVVSVKFNGIEGTLVEETPDQIVVIVPEGDVTGLITVTTVAGEGISSFTFQDGTGMIMNFDDIGRCWGGIPAIDDGDVTPTSGKFAQLKRENIPASSWWDETWVMASCGPLPSSGSASEWTLEFEMNVPDTWEHGRYEIALAGTWYYHLKPWDKGNDIVEPFTTDGWVTVRVPLDQFRVKGDDGLPSGDFLSDASGLADLLWNFQNPGPEESTVNLNFDNLRIVKSN